MRGVLGVFLNQLLVSLGQIMGASDLTSFGDPSGATGPLPNLV